MHLSNIAFKLEDLHVVQYIKLFCGQRFNTSIVEDDRKFVDVFYTSAVRECEAHPYLNIEGVSVVLCHDGEFVYTIQSGCSKTTVKNLKKGFDVISPFCTTIVTTRRCLSLQGQDIPR